MVNLKWYTLFFVFGSILTASSCTGPERAEETLGTSFERSVFTSYQEYRQIASKDMEDRPFDPFVCRTALDTFADVLTIALQKGLWVAYDTRHCSMVKVWKGPIEKDSNLVRSLGDAYYYQKFKDPWVLISGGDTISLQADYLGFSVIENHVQLLYELSERDLGVKVQVSEMIEGGNADDGSPLLVRKLSCSNFPQAYKVGLWTHVGGLVVKSDFQCSSDLSSITVEEQGDGQSSVKEVTAYLDLNRDSSTYLMSTLGKKPQITNYNVSAKNDISGGLELIAKADCKTCHNKSMKSIGPSYKQISSKYDLTEANIAMLTTKVRQGGTGVWGKQVMTPHPDLSESDLEEMLTYILGLREGSSSVQLEDEEEISLVDYLARRLDKKIFSTQSWTDGQSLICATDVSGSIYIVSNTTEGLSKIKLRKIADGLKLPFSICRLDSLLIVKQDGILTNLVDTNNDEVIDQYLTLDGSLGCE